MTHSVPSICLGDGKIEGIRRLLGLSLTRPRNAADNRDMENLKDKHVRMSVRKLMVDASSHVPILILAGEDTSRFLPIWIGLFEANAIATSLEGKETPRPMTHDLALNVLSALEGRLKRIIINDLSDNTFYAQLILERDGQEIVVDSRPSDAIAVALRADAEIWVAETVLTEAAKEDLSQQLQDDERLKKWLEEVDPDDLGKYKM